MKSRLFRVAMACIALVGLLTGCSAIGLNVETQLIPPDNSGEQQAIREALDAYVRSHTASGESADYTLKYPSAGHYLSAFITLDEVEKHTVLSPETATAALSDETAGVPNTAIAFYRRNSENALVHINLLKRKDDGSWASVADVEGEGEAVNRVDFGDLDKDGTPELLIGWHLYNTRDSRLGIYELDNGLTARPFSAPYTDLVVGDITGDGADDILLLSIMTGTRLASAQLFTYRENGVVEHGHTMLDSDIVGFGGHIIAKLSDEMNGVFLDCHKEQNAMITELIYWEDGKLQAPLCDQMLQFNSVTAREVSIASRDIDGDGVVEWPVTTRMPGFEDTEFSKTLWHTEWCYWNHATQQIKTEFIALIPAEDGYMLRLREDWEDMPATYNVDTRILTLYTDVENDDWLFRIATYPVSQKDELPDGYELLGETDEVCYAVSFAEEQTETTLEEFKYLFYSISEEGN